MSSLWVARDRNNALGLWQNVPPEWIEEFGEWMSGPYPSRNVVFLSPFLFPDLKPGEFRELVMKERS